MRLVIDTRTGIAGDIFIAGLMSIGADSRRIIDAMECAGNHIGRTQVSVSSYDDIYALGIRIEDDYNHLHESDAKSLLNDIFTEIGATESMKYRSLGILDVLCKAERYVHNNDTRLEHMLHHGHHHSNEGHHHAPEAVLHEAKDILIDIAGAAVGLDSLGITQVSYKDYINVGNGHIDFSHGILEVPAPATRYILENSGMTWRKDNSYSREMTTPTGASILAGLCAKQVDSIDESSVVKSGRSKGTTKNLPSVSFYLIGN